LKQKLMKETQTATFASIRWVLCPHHSLCARELVLTKMVVYAVYLGAGALAAVGAMALGPSALMPLRQASAAALAHLIAATSSSAQNSNSGIQTTSDSVLSAVSADGVFDWNSARTTVAAILLWYAAVNLTCIAGLFYLRVCHNLMGKDKVTGQIPWWSYVIFWPFHFVNMVLVYSKRYIFRRHIPLASEVLPGLWVGTYFSDVAYAVEWQGIVDLTTEFSERSRAKNYLCLPSWDGIPATHTDLTRGAEFILKHWEEGPVLCHCAAGIGRSATMVCAALLLAEKANTVDDAVAIIREQRPIVRLNVKMKTALNAWLVDIKKRT